MKRLCHFALMILAITLASILSAHTLTETNDIVRIMLGVATAFDDNPGGRHQRRKFNFQDPNVFFNGPFVKDGWSSDGLRAAFDYFVAHMAEGNYSGENALSPHLPSLAVMQCLDMNYTNAVEAIMCLAHNPTYPWRYRIRAIESGVVIGGVNDIGTAFVESIMTNRETYVRRERSIACETYGKLIKAFVATNEVQLLSKSHAISMLYHNRFFDWENAFELDGLFCSCIDGYSTSSNRLEMALNTLSITNCWPATRNHFTSVTNQLLSSGQPLVQLDIDDGE